MKILCFIFLVLGIGCKPRHIFECPKCEKTDSIVRITDTVAYSFPDELTLQALAYCDTFGKLKMRERDSIANLLHNLKPIYIYRNVDRQVLKTVKEVDKNALKAAWEQGYKYIKSQAKEKGFFDNWINLLWCVVGIAIIVLLIKIFKG